MEWGIRTEIKKDLTGNNEQKKELGLAEDLNLLYSNLGSRPASLDSLIRRTGLPAGKTATSLVELCLMGLARETSRHYYVRL